MGSSEPMLQVTVAVPVQVPLVEVAETNSVPVGNASVTVTPVAVDGPLLVTVKVYVTSSPARAGLGEAVLVIATSARGWVLLVTVVVLLPGSGSVTPVGGVTLAVLAIGPVAFAGTCAVTVNVAVPPFARLTVVLMLPVPLAVLQAEPDDAVHVQATPVSTLGMVSVTVAPVTGLGPSLVTVIV